MQQRNLIAFVILSVCLMGAWYWFLAPTDVDTKKDEKDRKEIAQNNKDDAKFKDAKKDDEKKPAEKKIEPEIKKKDDEKKTEKIEPELKKGPDPKKDEPKKKIEPKTVTIGGEGYHMTVDLIERGAGVRKVILNHFKQADWRGVPTGNVFELIQDDEYAPSYRMYHYLLPGDLNPVFGLGEQIWTLDGEPSKSEASFWTTVPEMKHLKIIKTYRVEPKDYHVTLLLEFHDQRTDRKDKAIDFRYQLVGAHGLPIEGGWYTSIYRNAFMGLVDPRNSLYRKQEESSRVSGRKGGDRFPTGNRADNSVQYAGVANQFFAAMILPDDKQPEKSVKPGDILAWARPTQDSYEKYGVIMKIDKKRDQLVFMNQTPIAQGVRTLTKKDAPNETRKDFFTKIHDIWLYAGFNYDIEIESKEFAPLLMIEDDKKNKLEEKVAPDGRTAKITFRAPYDGYFRVLATTVKPGEIGDYKLNVLEMPGTYQFLPRTSKHFVDLDLLERQDATLSFYTTPEGTHVASWARKGKTPRPQFDDVTMRVSSEPISLTPGDVVKHQFMLYHGPIKVALLSQFTGDEAVPDELVERYTHTLHLRTLTDYPSDNWFGWVSSKIMLTDLIILVTRFMHWLLNLLQYVFGYGLSIVVLTVMVRGAMFPISRKQALFSIRMQEMAPELKKIQDKYPDDPQAKMQATQEFYRKNGINPLGSCWPVFLQMPIFLGLYFALQESIHFRLAEFLWMKNLAAPDMLVGWTEHIYYISDPDNLGGMLYLGPYLNILPMIAVVFMMIQQMQTMPPPTDEQQAMQQKMLKFMTIFFGIMFYKVAAGLCIYFIASSLWGMAERKLLPKKKVTLGETPMAAPPSVAAKGSLAPKGKGKNWKKEKEKELDKPATTFDKIKNLWQEILKQAEKK